MKIVEQSVQLEFSRPLEVARVPKLGSMEKLVADPLERIALAARLKVPIIHELKAEVQAKPWRGGGLKVSGKATIDVEQISVVSLAQFRSTQTFEIERYYLRSLPAAISDDQDIEPIENGLIDLGEIVAETLALELDLYPRKSGEAFQSGDLEVPEAVNPFAALKSLMPKI